jgi:hypothetical protein
VCPSDLSRGVDPDTLCPLMAESEKLTSDH